MLAECIILSLTAKALLCSTLSGVFCFKTNGALVLNSFIKSSVKIPFVI